MPRRHVVVDGSNLATEGRATPSLAQLDEGVQAWMGENPDDEVIVVVDASFEDRIDESERAASEAAEAAGRLVAPPAAAIAKATADALAPDAADAARPARDGPPSDPVNDPLPFITFIAEHPLGSEVQGTVESYSSHGAFVDADGVRCYVPVTGLADPP